MNGNIKKINNVKPVNIWRKVIIRRENKMKKKVDVYKRQSSMRHMMIFI